MPYKDKEKRNECSRNSRKAKRQARGLQKSGRKPALVTPELILESKENRKEWEKGWRKEYNENSPQKRMLWAATRRAKDKGLPFDIVEDDIIIPTRCPYLGISLTMSARRGTKRDSVCSLDRIIPELGYIKGNIEVISHLANTMKQAATKEELISFAKHILQRFQ